MKLEDFIRQKNRSFHLQSEYAEKDPDPNSQNLKQHIVQQHLQQTWIKVLLASICSQNLSVGCTTYLLDFD